MHDLSLLANCRFKLYICHDIPMMAYKLENIAILNVKSVDYRCVIWNITINDAINTGRYVMPEV